MSYNSSNLADRITPPRRIWAQAVDATSRAYDLTGLTVHGHRWCSGESDSVWVTIQAETADVFCAFDDVSRTLDASITVAAGGTPAYADTSCIRIPAGSERAFEIRRATHKFLMLLGSTTGIARIYFSSENTAQDR